MQNAVLDVVDRVLAWDLPDEVFTEAVCAQVRQGVRIDSDDAGESPLD